MIRFLSLIVENQSAFDGFAEKSTLCMVKVQLNVHCTVMCGYLLFHSSHKENRLYPYLSRTITLYPLCRIKKMYIGIEKKSKRLFRTLNINIVQFESEGIREQGMQILNSNQLHTRQSMCCHFKIL